MSIWQELAPSEPRYRLEEPRAGASRLVGAESRGEQPPSPAAEDRQLAAAERLHDLSMQLIQAGDIQALYGRVLDTALAIMGADCASIQLLDPSRGELLLLGHRGFTPEAARFWDRVKTASRSACGMALRSSERVVVPDVERCETMAGTDDLETLRQTGIRAVQTTPLVSRSGAIIGMISTHWRSPHAPLSGDLRMLDLLARQAADLIDQKRAEAALREGEERYRTLFDSIDQGFCIVEVLFDAGAPVDYRFLEVNAVFEQQTGIAGAAGRRMRELAPDLEEDWFQIYGRVATTGEPIRFERQARPLGRVFDVYAFRAGAPEQRRVAILFSDVTERKRATEELLQADRRKTDFLAVLSHELRNPLSAIRNGILLLDRAPAGAPQADRARQVIRRQTDHLTRLVDDLLDVARISRGKVRLQPRLVDLCEIVRRTVGDLRPLFEQGQLDLRCELPAAPVWVNADEVRVAQVVGNLLHNAAKFTPAGGEVTVRLGFTPTAAELVVRDSGAGMEAHELERMWEPFAQADRSLARTRGGLGLGLSLVKALVELHGGTVRAVSEGPGRGSEFRVTLPRADAAPALQPPPGARPAHGSRLVLVIEDNVDAGEGLSDLLQLRGHRVRVARDGRSGLAAAREAPPDVVVCDLGLPDMSGFDVARAIRDDDRLRATRLIALSGYAQHEDRLRARDAGFDAHVAKPPDVEELLALLSSAD